jgi:signal transduction histidine kinase
MNPDLSLKPATPADQFLAVEVFSELLASTDPGQLGQRLTEQLREITGARTVMLMAHPEGARAHRLLHACPSRRMGLFTPDELGLFCPDCTPSTLPLRTGDFPTGHPLRVLLLRVGVESLLRFPLLVGNELLATLLLLDLPGADRLEETAKIVTHLSPVMALALKNSLAHERIGQQARALESQANELEERVAERTAELEEANKSLAASRFTALDLMNEAVVARHRAEESAAALLREVNERKRLEQERWEMAAQLRQQQKLEAIGTLASGVAHEINNPINGAMNYAQLILDDSAPDSRNAEYAREIIHETQRVATIVRNLLQFSRVENQTHSPARPTDIVERTLSLIRTVMRHDQITLQVSVPEELPDLKCRSQQIQQVLMNLMTNARDALNERYPGHDPDKMIIVASSLFEKAGSRWIRLSVEDHGTGITPEVRERIFDPFFTTKPRDKGTGLGLSISHGIVKDHHGELTVESEPGRYTRVHVDLPVDNGWGVMGET